MFTDKKLMTEEDIKHRYITPAIDSKWDKNKVRMEAQITDGKVNIQGNVDKRDKPEKANCHKNRRTPSAL